jgi:hypothetical protein
VSARLLSSSPIEAEKGPGGHLAGLLTCAFLEFEQPSQEYIPVARANWFNSQRLQLRGSGGFAPPSRTPDCSKIACRLRCVNGDQTLVPGASKRLLANGRQPEDPGLKSETWATHSWFGGLLFPAMGGGIEAESAFLPEGPSLYASTGTGSTEVSAKEGKVNEGRILAMAA